MRPLSKRKSTSCAAFSLLELVVVIGLLGMLMGLGGPGYAAVRNWLARTESRALFLDLESACRLFRLERGDWPEPFLAGECDLNANPGNWIPLLEGYWEGVDPESVLEDGFGNQSIHLLVDVDGNQRIGKGEFCALAEAERPEEVRGRVAVYSLDGMGRLACASWEGK